MTWKYFNTHTVDENRMYKIVIQPILTEKSTKMSNQNCFGFMVAKDSTKHEIKQAIEKIFKVQVHTVNVILQKGKAKRYKNTLGKRRNIKKAYVTLKEGHSIDMETGV